VKYLLDTCVISEFTKPLPNEKVLAWLRQCDQTSLFLSSITIGELAKGIAKLPDGKKKTALDAWLHDDLQFRFHDRIVSLDMEVMMQWGNLCGSLESSGVTVPIMDSLIAACALARDLILVTNNSNDFKAMTPHLVNPWI
jgi:toxin FitB